MFIKKIRIFVMYNVNFCSVVRNEKKCAPPEGARLRAEYFILTVEEFKSLQPKRKNVRREHSFTKAVVLRLRSLGYVVAVTDVHRVKLPNGRFITIRGDIPKGYPDIVLCLPPNGEFVGIETKVGHNGQTKEQKEMERKIIESGGYYLLARTMNDVEMFLKDIGSAG